MSRGWPTHEEMNKPRGDRLTLRTHDGGADFVLVPSEMTGATTPILVVSGRKAALNSAESLVAATLLVDTPSQASVAVAGSGDFPVVAAALARDDGRRVLAVIPEWSTPERRAELESCGAEVVIVRAARGSESEILEEGRRVAEKASVYLLDKTTSPKARALHAEVSAPLFLDLVATLTREHVGRGTLDAFLFPLGDPAQLGAALALKRQHPNCCIVGVQPDRTHPRRINGLCDLADPAVEQTLDARITISEDDVSRYLQLLEQSHEVLVEEGFVAMERVDELIGFFDFTGMMMLFAAAKFARAENWDHTRIVAFLTPSALERETSAARDLFRELGVLKFDEAVRRLDLLREIDGSGITRFKR